jgi:hypothetical protein
MKKFFLSAAIILGLGFAQVNAQNVSFGVRADANLSNFILSDLPDRESNMGFGATLGGFTKIDLGQNFAIQPELLFHFKSSTSKTGNVENDFRYWGMEIPVFALGQWNTVNGRFYAGLGPYMALGFSAKYNNNDFDLYDEDRLRRFDFGFGATIGYEFRNGFQINAGYRIGVLDLMDKGRDDSSMHSQTLSFGVGFRF